jgi:S-adenosylmethionine synthetase
VIKPCIPKKLWNDEIVFHINRREVRVGGPHGDTGLTGRKIIVDSYGGRGAPTAAGRSAERTPARFDRSACYMGRYIAKNIVAAGLAHSAEVQLAYAIGVANPVSVNR